MSEEQIEVSTSPEPGNQDIIARLTAAMESVPAEQTEAPIDVDEDVVEEDATDEVIEESQETEDESLESDEVQDPTEESEDEAEAASEYVTKGNIEINGESISVEEIKLGYMRQSDYTKKTQAVAEQRKAAEDQTATYESNLQALLTTAGADLSRFENVNWEQAAIENPDQYRQAKAAYDQTQQTYNLIRSKSDEHQKRSQDQHQAAMKENAKESLTILKSTIPNWNNDIYYSIGEYAKELGVSSEEFNEVHDHRTITALYKAMQYDRAKIETQKKVKATPQKTLSGKKAQPKNLGKKENIRKSKERLKASGSMDDAVAALMNLTS